MSLSIDAKKIHTKLLLTNSYSPIDEIDEKIFLSIKSDWLIRFKDINLIQKKIGRNKTKKNDPRVIDIDIVDFNGLIKDSKNLVLPHPRAHLRNFVLYPILEIDPKWSHPILKKNAQFLINNLSQKSRIEITRLNKNVKIKHD